MNKQLEPSTSLTYATATPDGFAIVADLMSRQDAVLTELDSLNERIEAAIVQINSLRQTDAEHSDSESEADSNLEAAQPTLARAA
jgi:hypothetical protein